MGQCSTSIKAYDFKKINSEISNIKRRICYLESNSGGTSSKFGVAGQDDIATQNRAFTLGNFELSLLDSNGNTNLLLDPTNDINFFGVDTVGDKQIVTGFFFDNINTIGSKVAGKTVVKGLESTSGLEFYAGDVDAAANGMCLVIENTAQSLITIGDYHELGNATYVLINDNDQSVRITNVPTGEITDDFATFDGIQIKKIPAPVESGTYTPTILSNSGNVTAIATAGPFQYLRVGNTVTVSGAINITTNANGAVYFAITPPISSDFIDEYTCAGVMGIQGLNYTSAYIYGNDVDELIGEAVTTSNGGATFHMHFTYLITVTQP